MAIGGVGSDIGTLDSIKRYMIQYAFDNTWNKIQKQPQIYPKVAKIVNLRQKLTPIMGQISSTAIKSFDGEINFGGYRTFETSLRVYPYSDGKLIYRDTVKFSDFDMQLEAIELMAASASRFTEKMVLNALAAGDQLTGAVADYLVSDNQVMGASTQSNKGSVAFSRTNLQTAITAMSQYYDIEGLDQLEVRPDTIILNIASEWTADTIFPGPNIVITGSTDAVRTQLNEFAKRNITPYYSKELATAQFILVDTSLPVKPLMVNLPFKTADDPSDVGYDLMIWPDNDHYADKVAIMFYVGVGATQHWYTVYSSGTSFPTLINPKTKKGVQ